MEQGWLSSRSAAAPSRTGEHRGSRVGKHQHLYSVGVG